MIDTDPAVLMQAIEELSQRINDESLLAQKRSPVFVNASAPSSVYTCAEAGFLRSVSWLYTFYYEAGRASLRFLVEKLAVYGLDSDGHVEAHIDHVHRLRTSFQHQLDLGESRDVDLADRAFEWIEIECGTRSPTQDEEWGILLLAVLRQATGCLEQLRECLEHIRQDEAREQIVQEWNHFADRYHSPHEFDQLIVLVAGDLGQDHIDPVAVRNRYYASWMDELALLHGNSSFEVEARKRIERDLLSRPVLPVTGTDVMREFGIPPGHEVGRVLRIARDIYSKAPCTKARLIELLRIEMQGESA